MAFLLWAGGSMAFHFFVLPEGLQFSLIGQSIYTCAVFLVLLLFRHGSVSRIKKWFAASCQKLESGFPAANQRSFHRLFENREPWTKSHVLDCFVWSRTQAQVQEQGMNKQWACSLLAMIGCPIYWSATYRRGWGAQKKKKIFILRPGKCLEMYVVKGIKRALSPLIISSLFSPLPPHSTSTTKALLEGRSFFPSIRCRFDQHSLL